MQNKMADQPPRQLAAIYIERQPYGALYTLCEALRNGTIFADLNRPYTKNLR